MTTVWARAFAAWATMAVAMTVNGVARVKVLTPRLGQTAGEIVSAATGIVLIQLIAGIALGSVAVSPKQRVAIALLWLAMTVAFEFVIGHNVDHKSFAVLIDNYNVLKGHPWPVVLSSLVAAPFLRERI